MLLIVVLQQMPRLKKLSRLTGDLSVLIIKGRAEAAAKIHTSLQDKSPWFTGTFSSSWEIKGASVRPDKPRRNNPDERKSARRVPRKSPIIITSLSRSLYIGNKAEYAGFVINRLPSPYDPGQLYSDLFKIGARTTPKPNVPNWYDVYLLNDFLTADMDKGFKSVGFKIKRTYGRFGALN